MTAIPCPARASRAPWAAALGLAGALLGAPSASAQVAPLPELAPGPFPVAMWDWDFGTMNTTHPSTGANLNVEHFGRIFYPTDGSGGSGRPPPESAGDRGLP